MILGVDLSLNSTGFCATDGKSYKFGASINLCAFSTKKETPTLEELYVTPKYDYLYRLSKLAGVQVFAHKRETEKPVEHIAIGQKRMRDAHDLSVFLGNNINDFVGNSLVHVVGIEDYSMSSETNNLIQIVEITSIFKSDHLIWFVGGDASRFFAIPGPKIKMLAGGGNFKKDDMLHAFINLKDPALIDTPFHKFVSQNLASITKITKKETEVLAPISDIIDAFWVCRYVNAILEGKPILSAKEKAKLESKKKKK